MAKCTGCNRSALKVKLTVCDTCNRPVETNSQRGRRSRTKGNEYENHVAKKLSKWWGDTRSFRRTPSSGAWDRGRAAGDLVRPDGFRYIIECKKHEGWEISQLLSAEKSLIEEWWAQAVGETPAGHRTLVIFSKNHHPDFVMMSARSFARFQAQCGLSKIEYFKINTKAIPRVILLLDPFLDEVDAAVFTGE